MVMKKTLVSNFYGQTFEMSGILISSEVWRKSSWTQSCTLARFLNECSAMCFYLWIIKGDVLLKLGIQNQFWTSRQDFQLVCYFVIGWNSGKYLIFSSSILPWMLYSEVPNRRAERNKRAGLEKNTKSLCIWRDFELTQF